MDKKRQPELTDLRRRIELLLKNKKSDLKLNNAEAEIYDLLEDIYQNQIELEFQNQQQVLTAGQLALASEITPVENAVNIENIPITGNYNSNEKKSNGEIGTWILNIESAEQNLSRELYSLLEIDYDKNESKKPDLFKFIDEPFRKDAESAIEHATKNKAQFEQEWQITTARGNKRWLKTTCKTYVIDNKPVSVQCLLVDITRHKKFEKDLLESKEFNQKLIQTIPFGIGIIDEYGKILYLNKNLEINFGCDFIGRKCWDLYCNDQKQCINCPLHSKIEIGETIISEIKGADEGNFYELSHTGMIYNGQKAILVIFNDISERKKAEALLKASEMKYHAIFDNVQDVFYQTDLAGIVLEVSPSIKNFSGFNREEVINEPITNLFFDIKDRNILFDKLKKNIELSDYELRLKTKTGELKYVSINVRIIFDGEGNPLRVDGAIRDITERKRSQKIINRNNKRYQELVSSISDIFFSMDKNLSITFWNKASERLTGMWSEDVLGKSIMEIFPNNEMLQQIRKMYLDVLKYRKPKHLIINYPGNEQVVHDINAYPNEDGISVFIKDITELKQAEGALRESDRIMRESQAVAHIGTYVIDLDASDFYQNAFKGSPEMYNIYGIDKKYPLTLKGWSNLIHPGWSDDFLASLKQVVAEGKRFDNEFKIIRFADGNERWVHCTGEPEFDINKKPVRMLGTIQDITERKLTEEALRKSLAIQRKIVSNIGDVILIIDKNGINQYKSPNIETLFGWKPEDLIGKSLWDEIYPEDLEETRNFVDKIASEPDSTGTTEIRYRNKSGVFKWIKITLANLLSDPDIHGLLGNYHDITERRQSEELLRKLNTAIEKSEVSVVITDSKGNIEYANPFFTQLSGFAAEEYIGKTPGILKSGIHTSEFYSDLWKTILSGQTWVGEFYNQNKNGEFYWENAIISPIENNNKEITHFVAIKTDITEAKKISTELIHAKERAEESDRLKSAFLANMSHEIRTPMNGILGFAELLKEPNLTGEEQHNYIQIIEKSGARMLSIINDIIDISKIESGQMKVNLSVSNANEHLMNIQAFFSLEAENKNIKLISKPALTFQEANFKTDGDKLYDVLVNLVKNALKYTESGFIEFGYSIKTDKKRKIPLIEFFVKDTGIGIPKDRHNAIFERFIQADIVDKRARQGAGLGLSIAKAYVEMLGGNIWVESNSNEISGEKQAGSTFYFTLPFHTKAIEEKGIKKGVVNPVLDFQVTGLKILIAEDDEMSRQLIELEVKKFAVEILTVQTGTKAIEICRENPDIDLVLMDIRMPEMSGLEAVKHIRTFNPKVIIIAQTSYALQGDREKAMEAGCNDYMSKPIKKDELHGLIHKYF